MIPTVNILFVCLGNICRSPTAEGVFRRQAEAASLAGHFRIDSAGLMAGPGQPPDRRATRAAARRGIDIKGQRSRMVRDGDFHDFDHIVAMDGANLAHLRALAPAGAAAKLSLLMAHAGRGGVDVPDPYFGGAPRHFAEVLDLVEEGAAALLAGLRAEHGL